MKKCTKCKKTLKSGNVKSKICATCSKIKLEPIDRNCLFCNINFTDNSRSKNQKYCSLVCNNRAGNIRQRNKVLRGERSKRIDKRDRKKERNDRYRNDIAFKLSIVLRSRLNSALKNNQKSGSAISDLGCSVEELKTHLESKFQEGMSWDNWSKDGWHIDHIVPISSFNLTNPEELKKACHYTNLQPLWAKDNFKKSNNKITKTIYILCGPNGCGKTTLANLFLNKFNIIDYDTYSFNKCIEMALVDNVLPNLIVTPIQAKRLKKIFEDLGMKVCCIYLRESREVIVERLLKRNGKITATIDRRIARYESLKNKIFDFYGDTASVHNYLSSI